MKTKSLPFLAATFAFCVIFSTALAGGEWFELCNGRDLAGWTQHGGKAPFVVEDGVIVGTTLRGEPNSCLCTDAEWDDFELEFEFLVDPRMNSGVQFRSQVVPRATEARGPDGKPILDGKGQPIKIAADRVHGCQHEIDVNSVRNAGGPPAPTTRRAAAGSTPVRRAAMQRVHESGPRVRQARHVEPPANRRARPAHPHVAQRAVSRRGQRCAISSRLDRTASAPSLR